MGFLDKAKARIPSSFGDETVRVVNYAKEEEEVAPRERAAKPVKPEKPAKEPRPPRKTAARPTRPVKPTRVEESSPVDDEPIFAIDESDFDDDSDSAFSVKSQDSFFTQKEEPKAKPEPISDLKVSESQIKDVLEVLQIPATFAIESDVFLPEDLEDIVFDLQAPYGFEQGQVTTFLERTQVSVKRYVELLRLRNEHVAKLASVVDRLQVDANNLRFQNEISNGINVMPTTDSEDLENQLLEAKLKIKRLEDNIRTIEHGDDLSSSERKTFEDLQDNFSIMQRENEDLKEEIYTLKNQLAFLEEEADDEPARRPEQEVEIPLAIPEEDLNFDFDNLPILEDKPKNIGPSANSAFFVDEEDDEAFASTVEILGDDGITSNAANILYDESDDDDDELDALMRDWNK